MGTVLNTKRNIWCWSHTAMETDHTYCWYPCFHEKHSFPSCAFSPLIWNTAVKMEELLLIPQLIFQTVAWINSRPGAHSATRSSLSVETCTVGLPALQVVAVSSTRRLPETFTGHVHPASPALCSYCTKHTLCSQKGINSLPRQHPIQLFLGRKNQNFNAPIIYFGFDFATDTMIIPSISSARRSVWSSVGL